MIKYIGKKVLVRGPQSGVYFGELVSQDKQLVEYVMKHGRERSRCAVVDRKGVEFRIGNVVCDGKVYFVVSANGKIVECMEIDMRKEDEGEMKFYWFEFADGYKCCVAGMSKQELRVEENNHGKLLRKVEA